MGNKKKSSSKKSKQSSKKSTPDSKHKSRDKIRSVGQPKSAPKSPDKSAGGSTKTIKRKTSSKEPKAKLSNKGNDKSSSSHSSDVDLTVQLEKARKRLNQLDVECREKLEEETNKFDRLDAEQANMIREQNRVKLDNTIKQLQEQCQAKIDATQNDFKRQQSEEVARLKKQESKASLASEGKRTELEKEIRVKQDEAKADIEAYRKKREKELAIQIKRLQGQCEADVKEYMTRRMDTNEQLLEQIRQKLDLEIKNDKQKGKLSTTLKVDKVKERFQKVASEETDKLNAALAQAIAELKASSEAYLEVALGKNKKSVQEQLDKSRGQVQDETREERAQLEAAIEEWENTIKSNLKQEQRQLERRKLMKQELLAMMANEDTRKLTDEDLIVSRFNFKIERSQIVQQSSASTVYAATKSNLPCVCKVTMLAKWSVRHRTDFGKHATKLARYLSANHTKAPYFVQVIDVLATDSKVYTFMEPLDRSKTLAVYLDSLSGKVKKSVSNKSARQCPELRSGLRKAELISVLTQVAKGAAFLNNMFTAHGSLSIDNVVLAPSDCTDLSTAKLVLTGLTRPIVYYNVESDSMIAIKGFDPSADSLLDPIDHLPPECFEPEFQATHLDAYSLGVLAYQLLRLTSPFAKCAASPKKMVTAKQAESVKLSLDKVESEHSFLVLLVGSLTAPQLTKRMPVDEILNHGYFKM